MKLVASILLIVIVVIHSACAGQCLGGELHKAAPKVPPCHQKENPAQQNHHDTCGQSPVISAVMPAVSPAISLQPLDLPSPERAMHFDVAAPQRVLSVLRI